MTQEDAKKRAAEHAVNFIEGGMFVGLGTGSTAYWAIKKIGERVAQGLQIKAIATSNRSDELARELNIPIIGFADTNYLDITIDGADEVSDALNVIKGGGGALLREKIVAANSKKLVIVVDESKRVQQLGAFKLPVEVTVFGWEATFKKLQQLGCSPDLRMKEGKVFITDNSNYIVDCAFGMIENPAQLHDAINAITGVVDNGLFIQMASKVIVAKNDGTIEVLEK